MRIRKGSRNEPVTCRKALPDWEIRLGDALVRKEQKGAGVKIAVKLAGLGNPGAPLGGTWISLEPEWRVTAPFGLTEIWVQHNESEGVIIPIRGGEI
jgi:hypothetical protein